MSTAVKSDLFAPEKHNLAGDMRLYDKEKWFNDYIQNHMTDSNGIVYSRINIETQKPFTDSDIPDESESIPVDEFSVSEVLNYENSGMTTGAYLAAMTYKYMATDSKEALQQASSTFEGICWIYNLGAQIEEGFFPKTYGGRISNEVSTDQYLYTMKAMMAYRNIAPQEHLKLIENMIPHMADYWIKRKYQRTYFGIIDMQYPIGRFSCYSIMAWIVSGRKEYLAEFNRLDEEEKVYLRPCESQVYLRQTENPGKFTNYEKKNGCKYLLTYLGEAAAMEIMELDECLRHNKAHTAERLESMRIMWNEGKLIQADNGYAYCKVLYDPDTGEISIPEPGYADPYCTINWSFINWVGHIYMPRSTMFARAGVNVARWLGDEDAPQWIRKILKGINPNQITDYIPADSNQIEDKHRFLTKQICGDSITNWLWAYWESRYEKIVEKDE